MCLRPFSPRQSLTPRGRSAAIFVQTLDRPWMLLAAVRLPSCWRNSSAAAPFPGFHLYRNGAPRRPGRTAAGVCYLRVRRSPGVGIFSCSFTDPACGTPRPAGRRERALVVSSEEDFCDSAIGDDNGVLIEGERHTEGYDQKSSKWNGEPI